MRPTQSRLFICCALFSLLLLSFASSRGDAAGAPVAIGSRLELFVDDYLIDSMKGTRLQLHPPRVAEKVLSFDRPWEGVTSGYVTVFEDGGRFRMFYRGSSLAGYTVSSALKRGETVVPDHPEVTCYAESPDGIHWTKPSLGLFDFGGNRDNNIVWMGEAAGNFAPFKDGNPAAHPDERYKAVASGRRGAGPVLDGFASPDGIHWRRLRQEPLLTDGAFDSLNVVFWDALRASYVAIYRDFANGVRTIKFSTSRDFLSWAPGAWCTFGSAPLEHLYTNATVPYFRAPHIYVAFPRRFLPWRTSYAESSIPGVSDGVFMTSRDGVHWRRFIESFIRPGLDQRNWIQRANTPAWGLLSTAAGEMSMYVERNRTFPTNYLERLVLRTDGFVSISTGYPGGEFVTKPLIFEGGGLILNYSTSAAGSIRLEVQDGNGHPLPGFALEDSPVLWGDQVEGEVKWRRPGAGAAPFKNLAGSPVRLRFVLRDADLYSLRFK